jgi:hypothetical protein
VWTGAWCGRRVTNLGVPLLMLPPGTAGGPRMPFPGHDALR